MPLNPRFTSVVFSSKEDIRAGIAAPSERRDAVTNVVYLRNNMMMVTGMIIEYKKKRTFSQDTVTTVLGKFRMSYLLEGHMVIFVHLFNVSGRQKEVQV